MPQGVNSSILLCTVGGPHQPIVTAIRSARPEHVVFFCTDRDPGTNQPGSRVQIEGKGLCIEAKLPNIPSQCGLEPSRREPYQFTCASFPAKHCRI